MNIEPMTANSNMLPSGQRCTDTPRSATDRTSRKPPSQVVVAAMPAALRARSDSVRARCGARAAPADSTVPAPAPCRHQLAVAVTACPRSWSRAGSSAAR